jgi:2,3-bisphosphoglycerate-independent phosphoglycerate mutase
MAVKHELWLRGISRYMGKENIKKDTWTGGRARNMENKN